jgi:hypothetical protein
MAVEAGIMKIVTPLIEGLRGIHPKWIGSTFEEVKRADQTPKGDFGEETTRDLIRAFCDYDADIINKGKGPFDILIKKFLKMEHKLATEDSNDVFQFNNLKKNALYDYVFTLGVSPEDLWFNVWARKYMKSNLTSHMSKGSGDSYKFMASKNPAHIRPLIKLTRENFIREITKIV